jgi:hypothetical protein
MFFMFIGAIRWLATRYNADHARPARVCDSRGARAALVMEKLMGSPLTCKIGLVRVEAGLSVAWSVHLSPLPRRHSVRISKAEGEVLRMYEPAAVGDGLNRSAVESGVSQLNTRVLQSFVQDVLL